MNKLISQVVELESYLPDASVINTKVSQRGVDWHIEHSLKVLSEVCIALNHEKAFELKGNINLIGRATLGVRHFPRGKGRAPKAVNNREDVDHSNLPSLIDEVKTNINQVSSLSDNVKFKHPLFNTLSKKRTIRFMETHTQHHIKIIKDILKK